MEVNPNVKYSGDILNLDFDYMLLLEEDPDYYVQNLPSGVRFRPTEEVLISSYLKPKLFNEPLPRNEIIEANIYQHNPKILTEKYKNNGKGEWYFFTPRERKYPNGNRPNRSTGDGYWKATGADKIIKDKSKIIIGFKKSLVFYEGKPPGGRKSHWIMHEYRFKDAPHPKRTSANDMRLDDNVLCMIYYNSTHKSQTITDTDEDPSTSNPSSVESTPSQDHHTIDNPVDDEHVDMNYCMQQQQQQPQQLLQNASLINDQTKYMPPNMPDHQFLRGIPVGNNMATNSAHMAANWPDHQFQGGKNMAANWPSHYLFKEEENRAANLPDNHQFTGGVDSSNYGMIDTSRLYPNNEYQGICTDGTYEDPLTSNPTFAGSTTSYDHHPIDNLVDHQRVDMHYSMQQQQQLLQNASWINDQPKYMAPKPEYMAPNRPDHQFPGGNNVAANRFIVANCHAGGKYMAANWSDHQFQGGKNMTANRRDHYPFKGEENKAANLPDNHQFTGGVDSSNYGNQYHTMMIDSRFYPNNEYQRICTDGTYEDPSTLNPTLTGSTTTSHDHLPSYDRLIYNPIDHQPVDMHYGMQQQQYYYMPPQQQQQQQVLQNASWINDQPEYMAPNRPDHQFPGGNNVATNSLDIRPDHQFPGGNNVATNSLDIRPDHQFSGGNNVATNSLDIRPDHQFPGGNNVATNSVDMAANWPDHQFQGGKNMAANRPDNYPFKGEKK